MLWTLVVLGIIAFLLWHFLGRPSADDIQNFDFGDFTDVLGNFTDFDFDSAWNQDPFVGSNETDQWDNGGVGGLTLTLQNALDDTWQREFVVAVDDWDNGDPDTLTLVKERVPVDHSCARVDGVMVVCNGNFGNTGWLGINEIVTQSTFGQNNFFITGSVAKMNEYYLRNAVYEERQYTMCHEMGHGFGLPHTDENFNNKDLGNCLDYTNTPENNMHPDKTNFARLETLYGVVGRRLMRTSTSTTQRSVRSDLNEDDYQAAMKDLNDLLRRRHLQKMDSASQEVSSSEWSLWGTYPRGAHYVRKLGEENEFRIHAHVLFAHDE